MANSALIVTGAIIIAVAIFRIIDKDRDDTKGIIIGAALGLFGALCIFWGIA